MVYYIVSMCCTHDNQCYGNSCYFIVNFFLARWK